MAKNNQKCVRLSDEVLEIVDNYRGNGFNDKFENLVNDFFNEIPKRKAHLEIIDKLIILEQDKLEQVTKRLNAIESFTFVLDNIRDKVLQAEKLSITIPVVSQSPEIDQLQHEVNEIQPPRKKYKQAAKE